MFVPNNAKLNGHIFEGSLVILCQYHKGALGHVVTYHECILVKLVTLLYCELILDV